MNRQEAFDKIWKHFVVEKNHQSFNKLRNCAYRGDGGRKCAIGCLIPDEMYDRYLEIEKPTMVFARLRKNGLFDESCSNDFLLDLQRAHDIYFHDMESCLVRIANYYFLTVPK